MMNMQPQSTFRLESVSLFWQRKNRQWSLCVFFLAARFFLSSKELSFENIYKLVLEINTETLNKLSKVLIEC